MQITFFSIMMSLTWISPTILILFFIRRNISTLSYFNIQTIGFMYFLCLLRMLLPLEFSFTRVIKAPLLYNWLFPFFMEDIKFLPISPREILVSIWGIISIILLLRLVFTYYRMKHFVHNLVTPKCNDFLSSVKASFSEFNDISYIIINPLFKCPMQIGFFHPTILLPSTDYSPDDLYYILKHEMTHFYNRDIWIKLGINIWKCLFWWYPLTYLLYYELDDSLELKCDDMITRNYTANQKKEYLTALLHVYENQQASNTSDVYFKNKVSSLYSNEQILLSRFKQISSTPKRGKRKLPILLLMVILFFMSYLFIFQSSSQPDYNQDDFTYFSESNSYIFYSESRGYELYIENTLITTLDQESSMDLVEKGIELRTEERK